MVANNYLWLSKRLLQKKAMEVYKLDAITALAAQVATLTRQLGSMKVNAIQASPLSYKHSNDPILLSTVQQQAHLKLLLIQSKQISS